jgi:hypothetical protein
MRDGDWIMGQGPTCDDVSVLLVSSNAVSDVLPHFGCVSTLICLPVCLHSVNGPNPFNSRASNLGNSSSVQLLTIYVPNLQPQGQLQKQRSVDTSNYISHPYRTTGKIIVLYILIFTLLDIR